MKKKIFKYGVKGAVGDSISLICAGALGGAAGIATVKGIDYGMDTYKKYTATEMVKKHFWSRPVEVYVRNGQPVRK